MSDETTNENEADAPTEDGLALLAGDGTPLSAEALDQYTIAELRNIATARQINLKGRDKKDDIIDTMVEATAEPAPESDINSLPALSEIEIDEDSVCDAVKVLVAIAVEREQVLLEMLERERDLKDDVNSLAIELAQAKETINRLAKKLKTKANDATMHGSVDDL